MNIPQDKRLGSTYLGDGMTRFRVWAPNATKVGLHLVEPEEGSFVLEPRALGYHELTIRAKPGTRYFYRLSNEGVTSIPADLPDPASRFQPDGVHGSSEVIDTRFEWNDSSWFGLPLRDYVIYELHVGTFTGEGTFDALIDHLEGLRELGVTAIELMPVAQFPGARNWGYDGVGMFAPQNSYGGPDGLRRLVDRAHQTGLAVILDVVYNHLGPEGNYLGEFGPYFTDRYKTPWGLALNFDGTYSDEVREFFIQNALAWITEFHIDALRLDAVHAIADTSAHPFLEELATAVRERGELLNRRVYTIAESDLNNPRLLKPGELGGYGLDAQWSDDFHHALHTVLTGESGGYYQDFGSLTDLATAFERSWVYSGRYSEFRGRRHGNFFSDIPASRFVVYSQNHDQTGNRMMGERLTTLVTFEQLKVAAASVILSPFVPLLFMGEEYGETAPFLYFANHSDPDLVEAVRKGRTEEFAAFAWQGEAPDPDSLETFQRSRLNHDLAETGAHKLLRDYYKELLSIRRSFRTWPESIQRAAEVQTSSKEMVIVVRSTFRDQETVILFNFNTASVRFDLPLSNGQWKLRLDSSSTAWGGPNQSKAELLSQGEVTLDLCASSVLMYERGA